MWLLSLFVCWTSEKPECTAFMKEMLFSEIKCRHKIFRTDPTQPRNLTSCSLRGLIVLPSICKLVHNMFRSILYNVKLSGKQK